jgi:hypothetical protein
MSILLFVALAWAPVGLMVTGLCRAAKTGAAAPEAN